MSLRNIITSPLAITTIALLSLLLNACGVGESDLTLPSKRPEGSIHGNVLGGLYSGGKISAYTFAEKETRQFIANADVQADGTFELDIQLPSQPLLIEVSGGNYFDPGSFQTVTPEPQFVLSTVLLYRSGETHETSITPLTHFNAGLLLYLQNTLASPISETLIKQTSQKIGNLYSVNQIGSPITLSYQDQPRKISITGDERQGLFINALAQIAYEERRLKEASLKDNYQLSSLTASLYEDIHSDGVFDGNAIFDNSQEIKPLAFGNTLINADFYRLLTAFALKKTLRYTPSLAVSDSEEGIETLLLDIAQRESDLIPSTDNDALHKSKPVISPITDFTKAKNGDTKFDFSVDNALILTSATMTINGLEYELELSDISKNFGNLLSISLDTTQFTDGVQQLDLTIKDSFDNIGNFQTDVTFDNSPPTLTLQSANLTNESEFLLQGTYDDAFSAIDSILVNGEKIPFDEKTGWEKAVTLSSGRNEFLIQISDVLGNKAQTTALVLRDTAAPVITLSDSPALTNNSQYLLQGTFIEGESDIRKITVNDKEATLEANQKWSKQVALNKGENLFTIGIEDSAGNYSEYATSIFLDDQAPLISVTSAALTNSPTFTLHGQYEELSPGENKINVNDIPVETMEDQEWSQPVQLVAGKNKFLITMKDEAGNLTAFYTEVVLDLLAPTIVLNSPGVSNSPLFSLTGNVTDAESLVKKIQVNDTPATFTSETDWELPVELSSGNNEFLINVEDEAGNQSEFSTTVYLDEIAPSITLSSEKRTNNTTYLMYGEYTEAESGVAAITINGKEANVLANQQWSMTASLEGGNNSITIRIEDKAGNFSEINEIISVDNLAPVISYPKPIETRFSNNDGSYFTDMLNLENTLPLYIELQQLSLSGTLINKETLDLLAIPYFIFEVEDPPLAGLETATEALKVEYRYSINDSEIIPWQSMSVDPDSHEILLSLTADTLSNEWYKFAPDAQHKIELRVSDQLANTTTETIYFKSQFYVPPLNPLPTDALPQSDPAFSSRGSFMDTELVAANYLIRNSLNRAFKLRVDDTAIHSVTQEYEKLQRENQVQLRATQIWKKTSIDNLDGPECPERNESDWQTIDHLYNRIGGIWVRITPEIRDLETINVLTDTPTPPAPEDWTNFRAEDDELYSLGNTLDGETLSYNLDYLFDLEAVGAHAAFRKPGFLKGWQLTRSNGQKIPENGPCPTINAVQNRTEYSYIPVPGFPRNTIESKTINETFNTSQFIVLDEDLSPIEEDAGWYVIPANHTIAISKRVKTPAMELHDDAAVASPSDVTDYEPLSLDKNIRWEIDQSLMIETQFDPEMILDDTTSVRKQTILEETKTVEFSRN